MPKAKIVKMGGGKGFFFANKDIVFCEELNYLNNYYFLLKGLIINLNLRRKNSIKVSRIALLKVFKLTEKFSKFIFSKHVSFKCATIKNRQRIPLFVSVAYKK